MPVFQTGYQTQSIGAEVTEAFPPLAGHIPRLTHMRYKCSTTAHNIYLMKTIGTTLAAAEAASGQTTLKLDDTSPHVTPAGAQETIDANDWICYMTDAGIEANDVASITGNTVTFNNNISAVIPKGAGVYVMGEVGRAVHTHLLVEASTVNDYADLVFQAGIPADLDVYQQRSGSGDVLLIVVDNATAAGSMSYTAGVYVPDTDQIQN